MVETFDSLSAVYSELGAFEEEPLTRVEKRCMVLGMEVGGVREFLLVYEWSEHGNMLLRALPR